jgi:hypothetical protein
MTFEMKRGLATGGQRAATAGSGELGDGLALLATAMDGLKALEERLRQLEDALTSGDALVLPEARITGADRAPPPRIELVLRAHEIGARIRRMNLRLGAVERALDGRAPLGVDDVLPLRVASGAGRSSRPPAPSRPRLVDLDGDWPSAS